MRPLTAREVAGYLGIHVNTVKRISPKELPYFTIGARGDRRYEAKDVTHYKALRRMDGYE